MMDADDLRIEDLLPHRHPFLFVDRIISLEGGNNVQGLFVVAGTHPFLNRSGERPVFPNFLLVEALGQVAALCVRREPVGSPRERRPRGYLVRIDQCRFDRGVHAGDTVILSAHLLSGYGPLHKFEARGEVAGGMVVQASITLFLDV
jgi:3-hydroxyacyl-[acyl-carrier-protein] dehydratase